MMKKRLETGDLRLEEKSYLQPTASSLSMPSVSLW
jgi:hypothetical protein